MTCLVFRSFIPHWNFCIEYKAERSTRRELFGILIEFQRVSLLWRSHLGVGALLVFVPRHVSVRLGVHPTLLKQFIIQLVFAIWLTCSQLDHYLLFHQWISEISLLHLSVRLPHQIYCSIYCHIFRLWKVQVCPLMGRKWRGGNMNTRAVWMQRFWN